MKDIECIICKNKFKPKKESQKCCSKSCSSIAFSKNLIGKQHSTCLICGMGINRKNAKFCSRDCHKIHLLSKDNTLNKEIYIQCEYCNNSFLVKNYMKSTRKFCSMECAKYGQNRPSAGLDGRITKICNYCGDEYKVHKYRSKSSLYCSTNCKKLIGTSTKTCKLCKIEFTSQKHKNRSFCSLDCSLKYYGPSKLEDSVYDILIDNFGYKNIKTQYYIRGNNFKYCVDFFIYDKIIIEILGDYWHCNPRLYSESYYHTQCKKKSTEIRFDDEIRFNNLKNEKYIVYPIWEDHDIPHEFNKNLNIIINEIHSHKKQNKG